MSKNLSHVPAQENNHWCPYYDQGLYIGSTPQGQSMIAMCCWQQKMPTDIITFDHDYLERARHQAQTSIPRACSKTCAQPAHVANERERSRLETWWDTGGRRIKKLHLEQSLACNLTCITCSSQASSAWNQHYHLFDANAPKIRLAKDVERVWQHLDLSHVESLHFTGGEPLMNPDNVKILEHLDQLGVLHQVSATYSTNGTICADQRTLDLWDKMRWVRLMFSLDGTGTVFEYTRYPASWSEVSSNIQWYRSQAKGCILLEVNAMVGIHNIFNMSEFYHWWGDTCQTGNQGDRSAIFFNSVGPISFGGRVLHLNHLPKCLTQPARFILDQLKQVPGASGLTHFLSINPNHEWLDYFERLDSLRNIAWQDYLSLELVEYAVSQH